ncbi:MAG TPA: VOC family protein [Acidobacteriaceae bacterium]|jgi:predicted enzyme related to lactoylglutathione lyase
MAKATGIGGVFLRARDPKALYVWYEKHLGLPLQYGSFIIPAEQERNSIAFSFFSDKSEHFPLSQPAMINLQVDDLDALLDQLAAAGVTIDPKRDSAEYGKFAWITDLEGNRVELWQPADE